MLVGVCLGFVWFEVLGKRKKKEEKKAGSNPYPAGEKLSIN